MIPKNISLFSILIFFLSCTPAIDRLQPPPDDLIPRDEMINIVVDLRLMDAVLSTKQKAKAKDAENTKYYLHNSILEKYGITRDRFERSHAYYQQDLKILDDIYAEAITRLSKMKSELEKE